ncbi:TPA: mutS homolog 3, partial [Bos taurus]
DGGCR